MHSLRMLKDRAQRTAVIALMTLSCAAFLCGCSRGTGRNAETESGTEAESTDDFDLSYEENYKESIAVSGVNETGSPYYGVLYVTVLDVNGKFGESKTVYSFKDKNDPENAWSVTGLEIGVIETELTPGADVAILFHGDTIRDGENLEFIAIIPDGDYQIKRTEGITLSNTMSSFTLQTSIGNLSFNKDNCRVEEGAMSTDSGDRIVVYYADGGALGKFPLRIYALNE